MKRVVAGLILQNGKLLVCQRTRYQTMPLKWEFPGGKIEEREQPRDALQLYQKAHELEPARPEPLAGRGLALLDLGQTAPAIAAFEQALQIDPRFGLALMGLAEAYRAEGKKEQAMRYYEKYLAVVPDGPKAQVARAAIKALQE